MRGLTNFPIIFAILFDFLLNVKARDWSHSLPPQHRHATSCPPRTASHWVKIPHCPGPLDRPFYGTHMDLQCVRIVSEVPPALPFDCIQSRRACVDLDCCTSSAAWASATSRLYLESCCHRGCSNLVQFGTSEAPLAWFNFKTFLFSLYIN
jgi:hypothetical protein